jgi:hypothetical protein
MNRFTTVEKSVDRIIGVIDKRINRYYSYDEPNISKVAIAYIKKYLIVTDHYPGHQLKILCTTSYLLAMKYLLDSSPTMVHYSQIVDTSCKVLSKKELELGIKFLFNFTPPSI